MLTIEEQERRAIWAGDAAMAIALGRTIDLEQERLKLRDLVRDAQDYVQDADWNARAVAILEADE
jgi:plasmid stability protein